MKLSRLCTFLICESTENCSKSGEIMVHGCEKIVGFAACGFPVTKPTMDFVFCIVIRIDIAYNEKQGKKQ